MGQENYVFEREYMYLQMFHRRLIHFLFRAKEKLEEMHPDLRWILC